MANKQFGNILRKLRNEKGFTQQQVADKLGLKNKSTLGSWEVGKSEPDGYTFLKLCKIYEIENIYNAFDEISPIQISSEQNEQYEKYKSLNDESKKIVDNLITQLLKMQENNS